jgi:anti-anti-sigma factor
MTVEKELPVGVSSPNIAGPEPLGSPLLQISLEHLGDHTLMRLAGEVDIATAYQLMEKLGQVKGDLSLDVGSVTFIDSTGLGIFVREHKRLAAQGSPLRISSLTPQIRRLLEISGLDQVFEIESVEQPRFHR